MKKIITCLLTIAIALSFVSCTQNSTSFDKNADFETIKTQAKGQTVSFYGWGGNEDLNKWLDNTVAPILREKYEITLNSVPMDIEQVLNKMSGEKQAGAKNGSVDMIWINGENFYSAKENGLLFGPFTELLPNYQKYIDSEKAGAKIDCGYPIDEYQAPYSKAQFVFTKDDAVTPDTPKNSSEFLEFAKVNKGKITYPALPDFTGSAFVRTIIHDLIGYDKLIDPEMDKEAVKTVIQPVLNYLKELNPYLWKEGTTFPATLAQLDNMFADGELCMTMNYDPFSVQLNIQKGIYKDTSRSFIFEKGTIGNTNFIAIAENSPNKAAAMVTINEILTPHFQATKYDQVKLLSALDYELLADDEKALFDAVEIGEGALVQDEILDLQIPEMPAKLWPIIEELWLEEVASK